MKKKTDLSPSEHTPGPWHACHDGKCSCRQVWSIPGDVPVFTARPDSNVSIGMAHHKWGDSPELIYGIIPISQTEANAKLIAAAPELRDALEAAMKYLSQVDTREFHTGDYQDLENTQAAGRAAIAKSRTVENLKLEE